MKELPLVTVVMPVRNEAAFIERSLGSVLAQDYPAERMEIIVADGMSTDTTREIVTGQRHVQVRMIDNTRKIVSTGVNAALSSARGDVVVLVGGHCEITSNYISHCIAKLRDQSVDAVGGVLETIGETYVARAIAAAMSSRFGVGGSGFRIGIEQARFVDTAAFAAYKRKAVARTGQFDEELVRNQDDEYNYRLRKLGGQILLSPEIRARYYSRATFLSLCKQYFQYGYWKVRVTQKHPRQMQLRQFIPAMFVLWLLSSTVISPIVRGAPIVLLATLALYGAVTGVASVLCAARSGWRLLPLLPFSFLTLHFSYGFGFLVGLVAFWNRWEISDRAKAIQPARGPASL